MLIDEGTYLEHYGILRRSGRYPWGSGNNVPERSKSFLDWVDTMQKKGLTLSQIGKGYNLSTTELRAIRTVARNQKRLDDIAMAQRLRDKGTSNVKIGERMGVPESTVRNLLAPGAKDKADVLTQTSNMLRDEVNNKKMVDIGSGVESQLGLSQEKLNVAAAMLKEEGYVVHPVDVPQASTGKMTRRKVLAVPGTTQRDVFMNRDKIQLVGTHTPDFGRTYTKIHAPLPIDPKRVAIRYKEDGGDKADGVIYFRPGVEDVSIGAGRYAQVRVQVGPDHFIKGMALAKSDLPPGVDILFNSPKSSTGNKFDAMKEISGDPDYPFESVVRQVLADEGTPNERVVSVMNKVGTKEGTYEEGGWKDWSKTLSSQFLSKQSPSLAKTQLNMTYEHRQKELDEIKALTNPVIKKKLLGEFADATDAATVHLEAAKLSARQGWHVILPVESMSPNEIHAPNFREGEKVVLIRYPHAGTFEIPELTVNNRHPEAMMSIGDARDAVGIHPDVAQRLSGADFDGDTVMVIPNNARRIRHTKALEGLKNFDPIAEYKLPDDSPIPKMTTGGKAREMGDVSNLITDMTIHAAPHEDIVRAVRHSMVVIDAEKHGLDYRRSARQNGIPQLKAEYQGKSTGGASTLISRSNSRAYVPARKERPAKEGGPIDKTTGALAWVPTGKMKTNPKTGKQEPVMTRSTKMAETTNAFTLSSGTPMETIYAEHANKLKSMANDARKTMVNTPPLKYSPSAKKIYAKEVASLASKLTIAKTNRPFERQANAIADAQTKAIKNSNPNISKDQLKKIKSQQLEIARSRMGANKKDRQVNITPKEWEAIQAGAISNNRLEEILTNTDVDAIRTYATPRRVVSMTNAKTQRAQDMLASGYTMAQVADQLGVSISTLDRAIHA